MVQGIDGAKTYSLGQRAVADGDSFPVATPDPSRVAVILNRNARKVTDRLAKKIARIVGSDNLFYSHDLDQAETYIREVVQRGYGTILSGGGDGTLARTVNMVRSYIDESNLWRMQQRSIQGGLPTLLGMPRFGFLKLGTGNGLASVVGAGHPLRDLQNIVTYAPSRTHQIPMIESEGEQFFFAGLGYDSMLLNDYNNLVKNAHGSFWESLTAGLGGYFYAVLTRTVPRALLSNAQCEGRIINRGRGYFVDPRRGDAVVELEPGAVLFEGRASCIAAGTSPFFGYGFKMFPFANMMPQMMQLRVSTMGPLSVLGNLGSLWRGHHRSPGRIADFLVEDIQIELDMPFPFQHSGDAQGLKQDISLKLASLPLRLVDCHKPTLLQS